MAANYKLTKILVGRTISGTINADGTTVVSFSNGSTMAIKVPPTSTNRASTGGTVEKVRQNIEPPVLVLDFESGKSHGFPLAGVAGSVTLRDKDGNLEYAD